SNQVAQAGSLLEGLNVHGLAQPVAKFHECRLAGSVPRRMGWNLAHVPAGPMNFHEERLERLLEDLVILRTAKASARLELHILYTAPGAGQSRQLVGHRAEVLPDHRL